jgi:hypothetical protein
VQLRGVRSNPPRLIPLADLVNAEKALRRKAEGESEQRGGKARSCRPRAYPPMRPQGEIKRYMDECAERGETPTDFAAPRRASRISWRVREADKNYFA